MSLKAHSPAWYDRLATMQTGYSYPWRSQLPPRHGEDTYLELVQETIHPDSDVLDVACAQGDVALAIAPQCRSVLGYDRTAPYIALARQRATERNLTNATFVCHDSSPEANGGHARLAVPDESFDVLICSKGPFHWIADAPRAARPGATLIMLVPDAYPLLPWNDDLPAAFQGTATPDDWARVSIEQRLLDAGLSLHSWWSFDVPEVFPDAEQLYLALTFGSTPDDVPPFAEVERSLARVFARYGGPDGLVQRRRRYLWTAVVPR